MSLDQQFITLLNGSVGESLVWMLMLATSVIVAVAISDGHRPVTPSTADHKMSAPRRSL